MTVPLRVGAIEEGLMTVQNEAVVALERLQTLVGHAQQMERQGPASAALDAHATVYDAAAALVDTDRAAALEAALYSAAKTAELSLPSGDVQRGRAKLSQARRLARAAGSVNAELQVLTNLIALTLTEPTDWKSTSEYGFEVVRLLPSYTANRPDSAGIDAPDPARLAQVLDLVASHAYYADERYEQSAVLAAAWLRLAPGSVAAMRLLALSRGRTGDLAAAEALWRQLLKATPNDASAHANLAGVLSAQAKTVEALEVLDRAIELAPDDVMYLGFRVRVKRAAGDDAGAIRDLGAMIAMIEGRLQAAPEEPPPEARSAAEYERHMSLRDRLDLALLERATCYERVGDLASACADLDRLARESDRATASRALREKSRLLRASGQNEDALAALRAAAPNDAEATLELGRTLVEYGRDEEAVVAFAQLVLHEDAAPAVVTAVTTILERAPQDRHARLVRAFAAETALRPPIADEDMSVVLEQDPGNAHLYYRRGRVRLMHSSDPADAAWNAGLTPKRVTEALEDLARAAELDPNEADARPCALWLADRTCTSWTFLGYFLGPAEGRHVFAIFPTLQGLVVRFAQAMNIASSGKYADALSEWDALQKEFLNLGMTVSASRIDVYVADTLLRLHDVQGALDRLNLADHLVFRIGVPMTPRVAADAERLRNERGAARPVVVFEQEFANVYPMLIGDVFERVSMLRIDALGRIGDFEAMIELLDAHPKLEQSINLDWINGQINIAARLRDAGQTDRALALLDRLEAQSGIEYLKGKILNLRGTLLHQKGDTQAAEADFRKAYEVARKDEPNFVRQIALNVASTLLSQRRYAEAREAFGDLSEGFSGWTPYEAMLGHSLLAEVALGLEDFPGAQKEIEQALELAEGMREDLHDSDGRVMWQGRLATLYSRAVLIAVHAKDAVVLLDLAERTRARAYLDAVESRAAALPPSAQPLMDALQKFQEQKDALLSLSESLRSAGPGFVDVELVRRLERVAPEVVVVQRLASGRQILSPALVGNALADVQATILRLEARVAEARRTSSVTAVGRVLATRDIAKLLAPDPSEAAGVVVLVEYFTLGTTLCCLILRSGEDEPSIHLIERPFDEMARQLAGGAPSSDEAYTSWLDALSAIAEPIAQRSLRGELICIVPCGALHQAPLHAAIVEGKPLLERNPMSYSPSASVLGQCLARARGAFGRALVFGDPQGNLPFARAEAKSVAERFGGTALLGAAATLEAFRAALRDGSDPISVLHFACHGTFTARDASDSAIALAGDGGNGDALTAAEVAQSEIRAELVVLSACESGRTSVFAGEEPVGLSRAFFAAGASTVVATLWFTNDLSSRLVVERFYDALLRSGGAGGRFRKAAALRDAMLGVRNATVAELLAHPDPDVSAVARDLARERGLSDGDLPFVEPRYWAPFVLIGSWH
jgi:CHAT domain-containing protein/tetratricopeptide (TPR) repeat protein